MTLEKSALPDMRKSKMSVSKFKIKRLSGTTVYVANLSREVLEKELKGTFSKYGSIENCHLVKDPHTKYVNFQLQLASKFK